MRNIEQILSGIEGITDEQAKAIKEGVAENYRSKAEVDSKAKRISDLEGEIETYKESIAKLEGGNDEVEALRKQVADYEAAESKRKEEEDEAKRASDFSKAFDDAVAARKEGTGTAFANGFVRESIMAKVRAKCEGDVTTSIGDAIEAVTKDVDGVWANPHKPDPAKMPTDIGASKDVKLEAAKKSIRHFMAGGSGSTE